jgi:hypothetical protein
MTVDELRKRLDVYHGDTPVMLQDPEAEHLWHLYPVLGEADDGDIVVIMAASPSGGDTR